MLCKIYLMYFVVYMYIAYLNENEKYSITGSYRKIGAVIAISWHIETEIIYYRNTTKR